MAACRVSTGSITSTPATPAASASAALPPDRPHHVSLFHCIAPPPATCAELAAASGSTRDDQPLDLTGAAARKRRRADAVSSSLAPDTGGRPRDTDSPLDLSVKRPRTDDAMPFPAVATGRTTSR